MNEQTLKNQWFTFLLKSTVHGIIPERDTVYTWEKMGWGVCVCRDYSGNFSSSASLSELISSTSKGEFHSCIPFFKVQIWLQGNIRCSCMKLWVCRDCRGQSVLCSHLCFTIEMFSPCHWSVHQNGLPSFSTAFSHLFSPLLTYSKVFFLFHSLFYFVISRKCKYGNGDSYTWFL